MRSVILLACGLCLASSGVFGQAPGPIANPIPQPVDRAEMSVAFMQARFTQVRGKYHAIVVGINDYPKLKQAPSLHFAINDARDLQSTLKKSYGFEPDDITYLVGPSATLAGVKAAFAKLADPNIVSPDDSILIFLAGHDVSVKSGPTSNEDFFVPSDSDVNLRGSDNLDQYSLKCIDLNKLYTDLKASSALHVLVLTDFCCSGILPSPRARNTAEPGILELKRSFQLISAGDGKQVAYEDAKLGDGHGAFAFRLLSELNRRADLAEKFSAVQLYTDLKTQLPKITPNQQTPVLEQPLEMAGEFVFTPREAGAFTFDYRKVLDPLRPQITSMLSDDWAAAQRIVDPLVKSYAIAAIGGLQVHEDRSPLDRRMSDLRTAMDALSPEQRAEAETSLSSVISLLYRPQSFNTQAGIDYMTEVARMSGDLNRRITELTDFAWELIRIGKFEQAQQVLKFAVTAWEKQAQDGTKQDPYVGTSLSNALAEAEDYRNAWQVCSRVTPALQPAAQVYAILAEARHGDAPSARKRIERIKLEKTKEWAHLVIGRYLAQRLDIQGAIEELSEARTLKSFPELDGAKALLVMQVENYVAAIALADKVRANEPDTQKSANTQADTKPDENQAHPEPNPEEIVLDTKGVHETNPSEASLMELPQKYHKLMVQLANIAAESKGIGACMDVLNACSRTEGHSPDYSELGELSELRLSKHDISGALKIVSLSPSGENYLAVARAEIAAGDFAGAVSTLKLADNYKGDRRIIAALYVLAHDTKSANEISASIADVAESQRCRLYECIALRRIGDLDGAKAVLATAEAAIYGLPVGKDSADNRKDILLSELALARCYGGEWDKASEGISKLSQTYYQSPTLLIAAIYRYLQDPNADRTSEMKALVQAKVLFESSIKTPVKLFLDSALAEPDAKDDNPVVGRKLGVLASADDASDTVQVLGCTLISYFQSMIGDTLGAQATLNEVRALKIHFNDASANGQLLNGFGVPLQSVMVPVTLELLDALIQGIGPKNLSVNDEIVRWMLDMYH